jgi:nucleotide-binding universal stress UspA family protein
VAPAREAGVATEMCLETGNVVQQVLDRAEATSADLIVLGTHGRSGFQRLAMGSVAEKVLRRAGCPVLTIPVGAAEVSAPPYRTILCATDFSDVSLHAVRMARELAARMDGRCIVVHVVEWTLGTADGPDAVGELRRSLEGEAREQLDQALGSMSGAGGAVEAVIAAGTPKREILELASARAADLIVLGVSGRGAVDLAVLGSTAHHLVRHAECPVLTVRTEPAAV